MKATHWILMAIIGVVLIVVGLSIMRIIVWENQQYGVPPYTVTIPVPATPFYLPGIGLSVAGGILITFSIIGFIIGYSKEAAVEVVSGGIQKWKESPAPPPGSSLPATAQMTKYCRYCGTENKSDAAYCEKCGKQIQ